MYHIKYILKKRNKVVPVRNDWNRGWKIVTLTYWHFPIYRRLWSCLKLAYHLSITQFFPSPFSRDTEQEHQNVIWEKIRISSGRFSSFSFPTFSSEREMYEHFIRFRTFKSFIDRFYSNSLYWKDNAHFALKIKLIIVNPTLNNRKNERYPLAILLFHYMDDKQTKFRNNCMW